MFEKVVEEGVHGVEVQEPGPEQAHYFGNVRLLRQRRVAALLEKLHP